MRRRNLAGGTIANRRRELARWLRWIGPGWAGADRHDVDAFLDARALGPSARATAISHLACFYRWAIVEELCARDPTVGVDRPRRPRRLPRPIREVDLVVALMAAPTWRLRVMFGLAALAGLRCIEISRLRWADVDLGVRRLRVRGKGDHDRVVPIHPQLADILGDAPRPGPYVLGRTLGAAYVSRMGAQALRGMGVEETTMHQLRHRFGTMAYASSGGDLVAVADLMGHQSILTTRIYVKLNATVGSRIVDAMPGVGT